MASEAQTLWRNGDAKAALDKLYQAEREAPSSVYVLSVSRKLRRDISDDILPFRVAWLLPSLRHCTVSRTISSRREASDNPGRNPDGE